MEKLMHLSKKLISMCDWFDGINEGW